MATKDFCLYRETPDALWLPMLDPAIVSITYQLGIRDHGFESLKPTTELN